MYIYYMHVLLHAATAEGRAQVSQMITTMLESAFKQ